MFKQSNNTKDTKIKRLVKVQERDKNIETQKCYGIVRILHVPLLHKMFRENLTYR
jgi:hypothetical protein